MTPGGIAVIGAILALVVGKYAAIHFLVQNELSDFAVTVTAEDIQLGMADEVAEEWTDAGKRINWPAGMTYEEAESRADYPPSVWAEAEKRWNAMPKEEQDQLIAVREEAIQMFIDMMGNQITEAGFKGSFSPIDLLFFGLAIFTAFKMGSGIAEG